MVYKKWFSWWALILLFLIHPMASLIYILICYFNK